MSFLDTDKEIHITGALRCAKTKYNIDFVNKGQIKFGLPRLWVDEGKNNGDGRGDVAEGMFATFNIYDFQRVESMAEKYNIPNSNIEIDNIGDRVYYRRKRTMSLPTFCLYGIKYDLFHIEQKVGKQRIVGKIPGNYFSAFSNIHDEDINNLPEEDKPSVVIIKNYDILKSRIITKLLDIGVLENEIINAPILYYDFKKYGQFGYYEINSQEPKELLFKRNDFEDQSEIRFIVNSRNEEIINYLRNNTIEIGDLTDIAQMVKGYFKDGIFISMTIQLEERDSYEQSTEN